MIYIIVGNRKKHDKLKQILTGKIYENHKQGKDKSYYDKFFQTKATEYTRWHIFIFQIWLWGFLLGFPSYIGYMMGYEFTQTGYALVSLSIFVTLFVWKGIYDFGKKHWYFQEIFDLVDFTNDESIYENADDARIFRIEEKIAEARMNSDIEKVTECRQNIKKIVKNGKLSESTIEYIKDKYYYLVK